MKAIVTKIFAKPQKIRVFNGNEVFYALVEARTEVGNIVIQDIIKHSQEEINEIKIGYEFEYGR